MPGMAAPSEMHGRGGSESGASMCNGRSRKDWCNWSGGFGAIVLGEVGEGVLRSWACGAVVVDGDVVGSVGKKGVYAMWLVGGDIVDDGGVEGGGGGSAVDERDGWWS